MSAPIPPSTRPPLTTRMVRFFGHGGGVAFYLLAAMLLVTAASSALFAHTASLRLHRDVGRMVLEDDSDLLDGVKWGIQATADALRQAEQAATPPADQPYIVVSTGERELWFKKGEEVLFHTQVATGSGKTLVREGGDSVYRFETPRGRLSVVSKEKDPVWAPPDWHYVEQARNRRAGLVRLERGQAISASDGSVITVSGNDVVRRWPNGTQTELGGHGEIVVDGRLVMPPLGTSPRRREGVLGTHRLNIGNGYALHGTNQPETIGRAVSHGCVRLRNEDIAKLYDMVPVGTPVYIYCPRRRPTPPAVIACAPR
jgi:lipoprotein-anchoring transpeptidase ErfK/SrfK